jgi:hypothetical protein
VACDELGIGEDDAQGAEHVALVYGVPEVDLVAAYAVGEGVGIREPFGKGSAAAEAGALRKVPAVGYVTSVELVGELVGD